MTGYFQRLVGFEAKDLTFEAKAKAKDFKMCPQGHSRGLRLCAGQSYFKSSRV